jgi:hypothetical protein
MINSHLAIKELLKGSFPTNPLFTLDSNEKAVDRDEYKRYLPDLCRYIQTEKREYNRRYACIVLSRILPDQPETDIISGILQCLVNEQTLLLQELLIKLLYGIKIPVGVDLDALKQIVRNSNTFTKWAAIRAFKGVESIEGEVFLLEVLRRASSVYDIEGVCEVLQHTGSLDAIPVLMARLEPKAAPGNVYIQAAIEAIELRLGIPEAQKKLLNNPATWKMKWNASPESFVGFVFIIAMMEGMDISDGALMDRLAEAYMKEMEVDLSPYQSYRELRLCSSPDQCLEGLITQMMGALESGLAIDAILEETGVSYSEETQMANLSNDLINDYFTTRLRRHIRFANNNY